MPPDESSLQRLREAGRPQEKDNASWWLHDLVDADTLKQNRKKLDRGRLSGHALRAAQTPAQKQTSALASDKLTEYATAEQVRAAQVHDGLQRLSALESMDAEDKRQLFYRSMRESLQERQGTEHDPNQPPDLLHSGKSKKKKSLNTGDLIYYGALALMAALFIYAMHGLYAKG